MKLIVYNPFYKDNSERNENYIQIFARNSGLPRRRRSKPSMRLITTPTKENDFDRHREQHIGEPMHLEDDERTTHRPGEMAGSHHIAGSRVSGASEK
jgi:hypothetical protein